MLHRGRNIGVEVFEKEFSRNPDSHRFQVFPKLSDVVSGRDVDAGFVFRVEASDGLQNDCCVFNRPRDRPDVIEGDRKWDYASGTDPAISRLQADDPTQGRRFPNGASGVGADCAET